MDDYMYEDDGEAAVYDECNTGGAFESAIDHDALLKAEQDESIRQEEAMSKFMNKLRDMIIWEPFLLDNTIDDLELVTKSSIAQLEELAYRPHTPPPPTSGAILPTGCQHIQSAAVLHLLSSSSASPRTVFLRLKRDLANIDEFMSSVTPARVESVYWNELGKYAFINFLDEATAKVYRDYMSYHPSHPYNWEVKDTLMNNSVRPMRPEIAEAVIVNGATRILRLNKVPINVPYGRAWRIAETGHPRFCHVIRIREGPVDKDFAIEFDDVGKAISARDRLAARAEMRGVGFLWMGNELDRKIEEFTEELNGVMEPVKINLRA
ncbi:hypothetical protein P167DRAFT_576776 [Morchella conica CCBAS932]|uniref:Uncharacterized protein n=1 Tax=Morchella conica CCBAS932 TaxID=1392247 RepID=A0A3N4KH84_9PEZI|nr:hypothetical protein P167DRAFT_576776 [Morchella conica CCBAS932]